MLEKAKRTDNKSFICIFLSHYNIMIAVQKCSAEYVEHDAVHSCGAEIVLPPVLIITIKRYSVLKMLLFIVQPDIYSLSLKIKYLYLLVISY